MGAHHPLQGMVMATAVRVNSGVTRWQPTGTPPPPAAVRSRHHRRGGPHRPTRCRTRHMGRRGVNGVAPIERRTRWNITEATFQATDRPIQPPPIPTPRHLSVRCLRPAVPRRRPVHPISVRRRPPTRATPRRSPCADSTRTVAFAQLGDSLPFPIPLIMLAAYFFSPEIRSLVARCPFPSILALVGAT